MPGKPTDSKKSPTRSSARRGHFLTHRDQEYLLEGHEYKQKTKLIYTGRRIDRDRRAYKVAYNRVVRESMRDARGALEDLAFLAEIVGPDLLYDAVTETRPLHESDTDDAAAKVLRDMQTEAGRAEAPLEVFLQRLVAAVGWEKWPVPKVEQGPRVGVERRGPFVAVRLLAAIERGLNEGEAKATHQVSIATRQGTDADPMIGPFSGVVRARRG